MDCENSNFLFIYSIPFLILESVNVSRNEEC